MSNFLPCSWAENCRDPLRVCKFGIQTDQHGKEDINMKLSSLLLVLCLAFMTALPAAAQNGYSNQKGGGPGSGANGQKASVPITAQSLSNEELASLLFMREEEKLALEVYQVLYAKWGVRIYANIAASEQKHFDAIGNLLERYGLADPAKEPGVFVNQDLQALYNELIAQGQLSLFDALQVGVAIEKKDIKDLEAAIALTDNTDIKAVYTNLLAGSIRHLDAFESHLELLGIQ